MSRKPRNEVGLNIVCVDHPTQVLFYPRMTTDERRKWSEAGPRHGYRGIRHDDTGEFKYSRTCPRPGCPVHGEYQLSRVTTVLLALVQYGKPWHRVWTVTTREMDTLIRRPARVPGFFARRAAESSDPRTDAS